MSEQVFISYAAKDRERVLGLVKRLRDAGVTVWIDQAGIDVATMWSQEIVNAIHNCKVMLLSISPFSTESENVVKELALASERKKPIIPVYLEPADIPGTMEYQLAGIQRVEYFKDNEDAAYNAMVRSLIKLGVTIDTEKAGIKYDDHFESSLAAHQTKHNRKFTPAKISLLLGITTLAISLVAFFVLSAPRQEPSGERGRLKDGMGRFERPNGENRPRRGPGGRPGPRPNAPGRQGIQELPTPPIQEQGTIAPTQTLSVNKLAILPFKVLGVNENEFIAEGMTMELISKLQPVGGLTVIASNSTMKFKDSTLSPNEIGQQLKAGSLLRGTIQQGNEQLKVIVNLIDANSQEVKWSQSFDGGTSDMLKLQGEIAQSVAGELQLVLSPDELAKVTKRATENPEAYQEYLKGRIEWKKRSRQGFANAIQHFEKAIELDPNFALAYSGLADIYRVYPYWSVESPKTALPKAQKNAEKALSIDPTLAEPLTTLAALEQDRYNWTKAHELYVRAATMNNNYSTTWHWHGGSIMRSGHPNLGLKKIQKAFELDPISPVNSGALGLCRLYMDEPQKSIHHFEKAYELSEKENISFIPMIAQAYLRMNQPKEGLDIINQHFENISDHIRALAIAARCEARLGNTERAYEHHITLFHLAAKSEQYVPEIYIADIFAEFNNKERAFYWMHKAIDNLAPDATMFINKPIYNKWKNEPEYLELLKKANLDKQ